MSIIMKDQADKSWIKEKIVLKPNQLEKVLSNSRLFLGALVLAIAVLSTISSLALATEDGLRETQEELMISPDLKEFMEMNGDRIVEVWDLQ